MKKYDCGVLIKVFPKKDYIKDKGKVRLCDSNIAKMNIFEVMYYHRYIMGSDILNIFKAINELIIPILVLITFPISYPIMSWDRRRRAKKEVKRCKDCEIS